MMKIFTTCVVVVVLGTALLPVVASIAEASSLPPPWGIGAGGGPLIPCGDTPARDGVPARPPCDFYGFIQLIRNVITFLFVYSIPLVVITFSYAGIKYMMSRGEGGMNEAKEMFSKVLIGFLFLLGAWLIVYTIADGLLKKEFRESIPIELK